jgi:hypothetical protein
MQHCDIRASQRQTGPWTPRRSDTAGLSWATAEMVLLELPTWTARDLPVLDPASAVEG